MVDYQNKYHTGYKAWKILILCFSLYVGAVLLVEIWRFNVEEFLVSLAFFPIVLGSLLGERVSERAGFILGYLPYLAVLILMLAFRAKKNIVRWAFAAFILLLILNTWLFLQLTVGVG